jgi:hypothetical protein
VRETLGQQVLVADRLGNGQGLLISFPLEDHA